MHTQPVGRRLLPWASIGLLLAGTGAALGLGLTTPGTTAAPGARLEAAAVPRPTSSVPSLPPPPPTVSVARLQPGLGVVGIANAPGPLGAALELTTDDVHWRDVTPPIPGPDRYGEPYRFIDLSFLNARLGWVVAYSEPTGSLLLYRTTDGGSTWHKEATTPACGSICPEYVDFVSPTDGWRVLVEPMAGAVFLARTGDAGKTWSPVRDPASWPSSGLMARAGAQNGFLADTLPPNSALATAGNSLGHFSPLWATTDGGATWRQETVALPADAGTATPYVDLPSFGAGPGGTGVLPIALFGGTATSVAFFTSSDAGGTWSFRSRVSTTSLVVPGAPWPSFTQVTSDLDGVFPSVGVAGPRVWWVVSGSWPLAPVVRVTSDFGATWSSVRSRGLSPLVSSVQAVSASTAWATTDTGGCGLVGTTDGGATWRPVCPGLPSRSAGQ
jgi:photosystem II stability/assembly factor-like uncharacterized protein